MPTLEERQAAATTLQQLVGSGDFETNVTSALYIAEEMLRDSLTPFLGACTVKEKIASLNGYNSDEVICAVTWTIEDVRQAAKYEGLEGSQLTDQECADVLQEAENEHDAECGIDWDRLGGLVHKVIENR